MKDVIDNDLVRKNENMWEIFFVDEKGWGFGGRRGLCDGEKRRRVVALRREKRMTGEGKEKRMGRGLEKREEGKETAARGWVVV